jgi:Domain of Unknown Function (DUF1080)
MIQILLALTLGAAGGDAAKPQANARDKAGWKALFDGKTLAGWKETNFGGEGEVHVENGAIVIERGNDMTGITFAGKDFPQMNYEVMLEGKKINGNDFFCTTTFPVGKSHCSLVVGGWSGRVVGLSSVDGEDASENATRSFKEFERGQWYRIRIRVTATKIQAWIDDKSVVDLATKGKKITIRGDVEACRPFGVTSWRTTGAVRAIRVRPLTEAEIKASAAK